MLETPVLFLIFNRPDTTARVFERIRQVKPRQLFVAADGPRKSVQNDLEYCIKTRSIIAKIDWKCEVKTLFREENLGCGIAIYEAINWFFTHVEQGIILEDDCLPHPTFFKFCENLLEYYKHDLEVFNISGSNSQFGKQRGDGSYYFSKYGHIWGWATWRRAWQGFDREMSDYPNIIQSLDIETYWKAIFLDTYINKKNIWGYQWFFHMQKNRAKAVIPNKNLILNIGFELNATHTTTLPKWYKNYELDKEGINYIIHPICSEINKKADSFTFKVKFKEKHTFKSLFKKLFLLVFNEYHIQQFKSLIFNR